jgi:hypothetical protein
LPDSLRRVTSIIDICGTPSKNLGKREERYTYTDVIYNLKNGYVGYLCKMFYKVTVINKIEDIPFKDKLIPYNLKYNTKLSLDKMMSKRLKIAVEQIWVDSNETVEMFIGDRNQLEYKCSCKNLEGRVMGIAKHLFPKSL